MPPKISAAKARDEIAQLLAQVNALMPLQVQPDLPPGELTQGAPEWYPFEYEIWQVGDRIRGALDQCTKLRGDPELYEAFLKIALDRRAKRGRQSFVLLFRYQPCFVFAQRLAAEINHWEVTGQIIDALLKMRVPEFYAIVSPFRDSKFAWIRANAQKYCNRYGSVM